MAGAQDRIDLVMCGKEVGRLKTPHDLISPVCGSMIAFNSVVQAFVGAVIGVVSVAVDTICKVTTELLHPEPDRRAADDYTKLRQHVFHMCGAQGDPMIGPNGIDSNSAGTGSPAGGKVKLRRS